MNSDQHSSKRIRISLNDYQSSRSLDIDDLISRGRASQPQPPGLGAARLGQPGAGFTASDLLGNKFTNGEKYLGRQVLPADYSSDTAEAGFQKAKTFPAAFSHAHQAAPVFAQAQYNQSQAAALSYAGPANGAPHASACYTNTTASCTPTLPKAPVLKATPPPPSSAFQTWNGAASQTAQIQASQAPPAYPSAASYAQREAPAPRKVSEVKSAANPFAHDAAPAQAQAAEQKLLSVSTVEENQDIVAMLNAQNELSRQKWAQASEQKSNFLVKDQVDHAAITEPVTFELGRDLGPSGQPQMQQTTVTYLPRVVVDHPDTTAREMKYQ